MKLIKFFVPVLFLFSCSAKVEITDQMIEEYWHSGKTLPVEMSRMYPWTDQKVNDDTGINLLIDLAHQCSFATLWDMPRQMNNIGYRAVGSMATLNSVLKKNGQSRIRAYYKPDEKIYPFTWADNPEFNVVITDQSDNNSQKYTDKEIEALEKFVSDGGGLVIMAPSRKQEQIDTWSIVKLMKAFGASVTEEADTLFDKKYAVINTDSDTWEVLDKGKAGKTVAAGKPYKKGHVVIAGNPDYFRYKNKDDIFKEDKIENIKRIIAWVSKGKKPVGGSSPFPMTMGGGGGIYPELEQQQGKIVLYYAENQNEDLLKTVRDDIPVALKHVEQWLPSKSTDEPMYLILAAGDGGGWAVNAFRPKENGIISLKPSGVISIFGHELAHTMGGPLNSKGEKAGKSPIPNQGEAHAGWYQGKVIALFDTAAAHKSNRDCNKIFNQENVLTGLDLSKHYENEEGRKIWKYGTAWNKVWYIWQKLDDRYGPEWYPRWRWIQNNRWADTPAKNLTWDEMVEDMSIAVGEDLFPFFIKLGTTLQKNNIGEIVYAGETLKLKEAPIELTLAGNVRIEDITDYTKPIIVK